MENVILVIHLILALAIIGLVLLQRSEGGGLGIGGSGGLGNFATAGATGNALTRMTKYCAAAFFCTSLVLGILAGTHHESNSLFDKISETPAPAAAPVEGAGEQVTPEAPATPPQAPAVPVE